MTLAEVNRAKQLLDLYCERIETAIYGDGQCVTAHWVDGGRKLFHTLSDVSDYLAERERSLSEP